MRKRTQHKSLKKIIPIYGISVIIALILLFSAGRVYFYIPLKKVVDSKNTFQFSIPLAFSATQSDGQPVFLVSDNIFKESVIKVYAGYRDTRFFSNAILNPSEPRTTNGKRYYVSISEYKENSGYISTFYNGENVVHFELFPQKNTNSLLDKFYNTIYKTVISTYEQLPKQSQELSLTVFTGEISPQVPYKGLTFKDIDVRNIKSVVLDLNKSDLHIGDFVLDGITFKANAGESFEFVSDEDRISNPGSFIHTELYGYGPTVITGDTRIGFVAPQTGRYFYVVKGSNHYQEGDKAPNGKLYSKYGVYSITVNKR